MRALTAAEIKIVREHNEDLKLTEEQFKSLEENNASFKVFCAADKILQKQRSFMMSAMSRAEANETFLPVEGFQKFLINELGPRIDLFMNTLLVLREKGLVTNEEIDRCSQEGQARHVTHKCDTCSLEYPGCGVDADTLQTTGKIFPLITGELADKVIECEKWTERSIPDEAA